MKLRFLACVAAACVGLVPLARSQTLFPELAFTPTGVGQRQNYSGSLGLFFTTTAPLTVSSLGYWDDNFDGVSAPLSVAIFEVNSGTIVTQGGNSAYISFTGTQGWMFGPALANQTNPGEVPSGRPGSFRLDNLVAPIVLDAGSYALVTWGYNFFNQLVNAPEGGAASTLNTFGGVASFNNARYNDTPGVMPTNLDSNVPQYLIATFSPDIVIPEPGTYALMAGSAGLAASWWLRRRRTQVQAAQPVQPAA